MILHIPHSAIAVPTWASGTIPASEMALMTDWFTDRLFDHPAATRLIFPWSRYVCDVERLLDDPLEAQGQGILYTHLRDGTIYRTPSEQECARVQGLYENWHRQLRSESERWTSMLPAVVLVDCHSFCAAQVDRDEADLPDVCIGINRHDDARLNELVTRVEGVFDAHGYSTAINVPYGGAIEPTKNQTVLCIMLELNKRIYLGADLAPSDYYERARLAVTAALDAIIRFENAAA